MNTEKKENNVDIFVIPSPLSENGPKTARQAWWKIDKEMIRFKIHYLLFVGALGTSLPFLTIFAKHRIGLSATSLAAILTSQQFIFIFTKTLLGYLADYFNKLKTMICILTVIPTIFLYLLLAIPKIKNTPPEENNIHMYFEPYVNKIESCKLQLANMSSAMHQLSTNEFCSAESDEQLISGYKCSPTLMQRSSEIAILQIGMISTNISNKETYYEKIKPSNATLDFVCATCCNATSNCYIISCPEAHHKPSPEASQFKTYQFWLFAFELLVAQIALNALFTLSDTACCESVVKTGSDLGRQRLFGAISWGFMSPIGGVLNDYTDDYVPGWIITGIMLIMSLWNLWKLELVQPQFSQNILKDVCTLLKSKEFLTFEIGVLMNGMGIGIMWFYQIWFLTTIGASRLLCGLVQTVQCFAGEVPFMFYSGWFIKKLGHSNVLSLALMAYSARFLWYSYLENPWLVLPMECVHGFMYGIFYPAVASYAKLSSVPGTEATTQSILFSTHEGLGAGLGCVLAGIGFDTIGARRTFLCASIFACCGMVINSCFTLWHRRQKKLISVTSSAIA